MHAELAAIRERVHKITIVREIAASHRLDKMYHPRLEKLAAWRRRNAFDRSEVLTERQRTIQERACPVDDPEHSKIDILNRNGCPRLKNLLKVCGQR